MSIPSSTPDHGTPAAMLLERDAELTRLRGYLDEAARGQGSLVLLGGSAGIGKSVLTQAFCGSVKREATVLAGACDALSTPQPLAPLMDVAALIGGQAGQTIEHAEARHERFRAFLNWLGEARRPCLVIFEDVHWADEATLDLLRFLGRRIATTRALLVVTYRSDEVGPGHPLRVVFGDLASLRTTHRIELVPLSEEAVGALAAGTSVDPTELHRLTGGNPFFVTEVLAAGGSGIPATVRDAVLARAARLSPDGRAALDAAAVIGSPAELWLLERLLARQVNGLDECIDAGMLRVEEDDLNFRHEIARETVLEALSPPARTSLHRRVLAALEASPEGRAMPARLAHHAEESRDRDAVLKYALAAGRNAASLHAHREAAAQYRRALRFAGRLEPGAHAAVLELYAQECYLTEQMDAAIQARREALEQRRRLGDPLREGENLYRMARVLVLAGRNAEAEEASQSAISVLEAQPPSAELAAAYQIQAHLLMLNRDNAEAIERGMQAIGLAERLGAEDALIYAHNSVGSAMLLAGDNEGVTFLERSVQMAVEAGLDDYAVAAYGNLGSASGEMYRFEQADRYLAEGIAYCADRDLDFERNYMLAWQALSHFYQGRWTEAGEVASTLLRLPNLAAISQIMAQVALGRVRARRGDPEVMNVLDEALDAARRTATLQRLGPVHAARAEAAWLTGESEAAAAEAHSAYDLAIRQGHPWFIGELAYWRWKAGDLDSPPALAAEPFKLQMRGDWAAAAARWQALNCPYEAARALAESDDEAALRRAFDDFDRLGAMPARAEVAQRLRELGAQAIPRGARPATRANPAGLTARQVEVARLVAEGCSNAEIAKRLFISHKTVEHHISALFAKLGVESRRNAARAAVRLGINLTDPESDR